MSDEAMNDTEWIVDLKSCLTSAKDGIPLNQVENAFLELTGKQIPYKNLGYPSLAACLISYKEFTIDHRDGVSIVIAVNSDETQHLTDLIKKQRPNKNKKKKMFGVKVQTIEKIKSQSRKRNISECDNDNFSLLSLYYEATKQYKPNDINILLSNIGQWDIESHNKYKQINTFICFVCYFKTNEFNDWKLHIISLTHLTECEKTDDLYSHPCSMKDCQVLLFGPEKLLSIHYMKHQNKNPMHMAYVMAEVMKRFINKLNNTMYFCSHCKMFRKKPIHSEPVKLYFKKHLVEYYCKYCKIDLFCTPEMIHYHSLSVEHMTLKCFDKLLFENQTNYKKLKISEQSNENTEINLLPTVKNEIITDSSVQNVAQSIELLNINNIIKITNQNIQDVPVNESLTDMNTDSAMISNKVAQLSSPVNNETTPNEIISRSKYNVASSYDKLVSNIANLEIEKTQELYSDKAYGNYVAERLAGMKDSAVKNDIKYEIDRIFFNQMKKLSLNNEYP